MDGVNVSSEKLFTQYHGVCIQYNVDLLDIWGGTYLYNDWGKRWVEFAPKLQHILSLTFADFVLRAGNLF